MTQSGPPPRLKACRILRAGIATDDVVPTAAWVVGIVYPELSVIENVEGLGRGTRISLDSLTLKCFSTAMSKFKRPGLLRKFPARIAEGESPGATN